MIGSPEVIEKITVLGSEVPTALVAVTTVSVTPGVRGVPEITPVLEFKVKPAGKGIAVKLVGLFVAVIV